MARINACPGKRSACNGTSKKGSAKTIRSRNSTSRSSKSVKQIFCGKFMSIAGTIISCDSPVAHEKVAGWITHHGGIYEKDVTDNTTHLICSIDEYKKNSLQVQKARDLGFGQCKIVVFDWLDDCLQSNPKRLRVEKNYTLDRTIKSLKGGIAAKVKHEEKFEEGFRLGKELVDKRLHRIHYDATGFEYKVVLKRIDVDARVKVETFTLVLFESIARPPTFMCGAKYSRSHRPVCYYREECRPKMFPEAFKDFAKLFLQRTGIKWDLRLERHEQNDIAFVYTPPKIGCPVGLLPLGYIRPEDRDPQETVVDSEESRACGPDSGGLDDEKSIQK